MIIRWRWVVPGTDSTISLANEVRWNVKRGYETEILPRYSSFFSYPGCQRLFLSFEGGKLRGEAAFSRIIYFYQRASGARVFFASPSCWTDPQESLRVAVITNRAIDNLGIVIFVRSLYLISVQLLTAQFRGVSNALGFLWFCTCFIHGRNGLIWVFVLVFNLRLDSSFLAGLAHDMIFLS